MELTQPPIQWVPRTLKLEEKQLVCETDYKPHLRLSLGVSDSTLCTLYRVQFIFGTKEQSEMLIYFFAIQV